MNPFKLLKPYMGNTGMHAVLASESHLYATDGHTAIRVQSPEAGIYVSVDGLVIPGVDVNMAAKVKAPVVNIDPFMITFADGTQTAFGEPLPGFPSEGISKVFDSFAPNREPAQPVMFDTKILNHTSHWFTKAQSRKFPVTIEFDNRGVMRVSSIDVIKGALVEALAMPFRRS